MGGGAGPGELDQIGLIGRTRDTADGAHLGVGQLPSAEGLGHGRKLAKGPRHAHVLPGRGQRHATAPVEPMGRRAALPIARALPAIELADQLQPAAGGGGDVGAEGADLAAQGVGGH